MSPNSKKNILPAIAIALVLGCIAVAVVWSDRNGITRSRESGSISVQQAKPDRPPTENKVGLKSRTSYLVRTESANPDDTRPVVAPADQAFWRAESPDGSKIIEINNHTAQFELTDKVTGKKVSFSNWQKVDDIDYEVVKWTWKDNRTLLGPGWSDLYDDERRDVGDVKLFIYQCGVSKQPEPVLAPSPRPGMCIRLEGFNKMRHVLLAEVFLDGYKRYGTILEGEQLLGAFEILPRDR